MRELFNRFGELSLIIACFCGCRGCCCEKGTPEIIITTIEDRSGGSRVVVVVFLFLCVFSLLLVRVSILFIISFVVDVIQMIPYVMQMFV